MRWNYISYSVPLVDLTLLHASDVRTSRNVYRSVEKFIRVPAIRRGSIMVLCLSLCSVKRIEKDVSRILLQISIDTDRPIDQNLKNEVFQELSWKMCAEMNFYKRLHVIKRCTLFSDISGSKPTTGQRYQVQPEREREREREREKYEDWRQVIKRPQKGHGRQVTLEAQINCNSAPVSQ